MEDSALISFLLEHNREKVKEYTGPDASLWRRQYRAKHPTEIAALKCMDGRLNLPLITDIPVGIIQPFRNIGGQFDLGWPYFGSLIHSFANAALDRGHDVVFLVTYHFSKGDQHRGCAGWKYDTEAARKGACELRSQCERVFGGSHAVVYPITLGIETDEDALIFHGKNGATLALAEEAADIDILRIKFRALYPDMKPQIVEDLLPLALGNIAHIAKIREEHREPLDASHREQVMGIGSGFDWLHLHNKALLIGPYSYDVQKPIATAAKILLSNITEGRIPAEEGVVIMTSAAYREDTGTERTFAEEKAYSLAKLAQKTIEAEVPELSKYASYLVGTLDLNTRAYERLPYPKE